jgi:hypothetical protein
MDDLLTGSDTIKGAFDQLTQIIIIAREYGFNLRKKKANSLAIIKGFPIEAVETPQEPKEFNQSTTSM